MKHIKLFEGFLNEGEKAKDVYLFITTKDRKHGFWDEILVGSKKKQNEALLKEVGDLSRLQKHFLTPFTVVSAEVGSVGGGDANYDLTVKTTIDPEKAKEILSSSAFKKDLNYFMAGIVTPPKAKEPEILYGDDLKKEINKVLTWIGI